MPHSPRSQRRNMVVLLTTTLAIVGGRYLWWQLIPLRLRTLGADDGQVSLVFSLMLLLGPMQLAGGLVSDRLGRRYAIAVPSLALVPCLIIALLARHWLWMGVALWLIGIVGAVQQPGFQALLAESADDAGRGRVFGAFYMITALAMMLGPALGAALLPGLGIVGLMGITAGAAFVAGMARLLLLREGRFAAAGEAVALEGRLLLREPLLRRLIVTHCLYMLLLSLTLQGPFVALHAADSLGMGEQAVNVLFALGGIGAALAALGGGGLADRFGGRATGAVLLGLHALMLIAWAGLTPSGWLGYALFAVSWIALQAGMVGYATWFSAFAPAAVRGRVLGLVGAVGSVVSALGPQAGAWLRGSGQALSAGEGQAAARLASAAPFALALAVTLTLAVLLLRMPGRQQLATQAGQPGSVGVSPPVR